MPGKGRDGACPEGLRLPPKHHDGACEMASFGAAKTIGTSDTADAIGSGPLSLPHQPNQRQVGDDFWLLSYRTSHLKIGNFSDQGNDLQPPRRSDGSGGGQPIVLPFSPSQQSDSEFSVCGENSSASLVGDLRIRVSHLPSRMGRERGEIKYTHKKKKAAELSLL
jgi:hypothetical protein